MKEVVTKKHPNPIYISFYRYIDIVKLSLKYFWNQRLLTLCNVMQTKYELAWFQTPESLLTSTDNSGFVAH